MNKKKAPYTILVINPGSTSTKIALFHDSKEKKAVTVAHDISELHKFTTVYDQKEFRLSHIKKFLTSNDITSIDAVAARGGLLRPIPGGVYQINDTMITDLQLCTYGEHASNLGGILSAQIAENYSCTAYIADPVVVDEMDSVARISGMPEIERKSIFHALNQKSVARRVAKQVGKPYEKCNFIVAHLGGGISVGAHCQGRVIDVNNALDGDGPFSPERSGGVPARQLVKLTHDNIDHIDDIYRKITGHGGLTAYCGTNDLTELSQMIEQGDDHAGLIFSAMALQISKEIAMHGATLKGKVDRIILTGGMAYNEMLVNEITTRVSFIAPIVVLAGEEEMQSLAENILAVLQKKQKVLTY